MCPYQLPVLPQSLLPCCSSSTCNSFMRSCSTQQNKQLAAVANKVRGDTCHHCFALGKFANDSLRYRLMLPTKLCTLRSTCPHSTTIMTRLLVTSLVFPSAKLHSLSLPFTSRCFAAQDTQHPRHHTRREKGKAPQLSRLRRAT